MPPAATKFTNHHVVCGAGRVGRQVIVDLMRREREVVVVDLVEPDLELDRGVHLIIGDATHDAVLERAGVSSARGLVAATGSDASNLVITLSARAVARDLVIVARANDPAAEPKLRRAGATRVVSPYVMGGHRMATQLAAPGMIAFLDTLRDAENVDLWLEEVVVSEAGRMVGRRVEEVIPRTPGGATLVAVRQRGSDQYSTAAMADVVLGPGDRLIVMGSREPLRQLADHAGR